MSFEQLLVQVQNEHSRQIKLKERQMETLLIEVEKLKETVKSMEQIHQQTNKRNEKHLTKLALKCTKQEELLKRSEFEIEDIQNKQIQMLTEENSKLFIKIATERESNLMEIAQLKLEIKNLKDLKREPERAEVDTKAEKVKTESKVDHQIPKRKRSPELPHKYVSVERDKATRRKMHGVECFCCKDYYRLTANVPALKEIGQKVDTRVNQSSRHRVWAKRPDTPPGFWDVGFPNTQEIDSYKIKS